MVGPAETRSLESLRPYSGKEFFPDLAEPELNALAEDLKRNGQTTPVEILPDGTIISGHQRVRAAGLLEWSEVTVIVRHDLAHQGESATRRRFLEANLHRRQLDDFARLRVLKELADIAWNESERRGEHRAFVARFFARHGVRLSGKTLERRFKTLALPPAILHAFSQKRLRQSDLLAVAELPAAQVEEISERIEMGEDPRNVIEDHLSDDGEADPARDAYLELVKFGERRLPALRGEGRRLVGSLGAARALQSLTRLKKFVDYMLEREGRSA